MLTETGALAVETGPFTGRSPNDRYLVLDPVTAERVDWGDVNRPLPLERFEDLWRRAQAYLDEREHFVLDAQAGNHPRYRAAVRARCEYAWQCLFLKQLLIEPAPGADGAAERPITLLAAPGFTADPARDGTASETVIAIDLERRRVLVGGTHYAGELKKAVFTLLNYALPDRGVLPMHCSANLGRSGDVALFFGLSGTGKTTLSADPERALIGDDEHGWAPDGIFNFEGGCYAKTIGLSAEREPQIWQAIRFGAILENVDVDPERRRVDYESARLTENTRAAFPLAHIPGSVPHHVEAQPQVILFLTADASGILPPVARLSVPQAMYYFLSGYTSKLAGTERGVTTPVPTFSACFGAPFLPRPAHVYAAMLGERVSAAGARVFLINTGWTGGPYGVGRRIELGATRAIVRAAAAGLLDEAPARIDPVFGFAVPLAVPGVRDELLDPRATWADPRAYDEAAQELARHFARNMAGLRSVPQEIAAAGPKWAT